MTQERAEMVLLLRQIVAVFWDKKGHGGASADPCSWGAAISRRDGSQVDFHSSP